MQSTVCGYLVGFAVAQFMSDSSTGHGDDDNFPFKKNKTGRNYTLGFSSSSLHSCCINMHEHQQEAWVGFGVPQGEHIAFIVQLSFVQPLVHAVGQISSVNLNH